jgi:hypothetical protein
MKIPQPTVKIVLLIAEGISVNQSSLNRTLNQIFGILLGMGLAIWVLRGFGILTFLPGGVIGLFFLAAIAVGILSYIQKTWWRF